MSKKRTLDNFFSPVPLKKPRGSVEATDVPNTVDQEAPCPLEVTTGPPSTHPTYPFPIVQLSPLLFNALTLCPSGAVRAINNQPDLELLYYAPFIPKDVHMQLFHFLRCSLFFYRVTYKIKRGTFETTIITPRYTTVFGLDDTSIFSPTQSFPILDSTTHNPISTSKYKHRPRPIPACLDALRRTTEAVTGCTFNFCLVNYYASGDDSISYHSDDERFLGVEPAIASFSLGAKRDFLMKRKSVPTSSTSTAADVTKATDTLKLPLASGDMVLMRGKTQANWLHSIPKRKGGGREMGRINITFRKALERYGTDNYYRYNVGDGEVFRWSGEKREMVPWKAIHPKEEPQMANYSSKSPS